MTVIQTSAIQIVGYHRALSLVPYCSQYMSMTLLNPLTPQSHCSLTTQLYYLF